MRALHLFFRLHLPHKLRNNWKSAAKLDYFDDETFFREADRTEYQPFLALLERNAQKYPNLKLSLAISGPWIEQAQEYSPELLERIHKLANLGCIELLIEPYNYSLAFFYDQEEFSAQIALHQRKMEHLFGGNSQILVLPELIYNDNVAKWAEKTDFTGVLAGAAETLLDWRSTNQVFHAAEHPKLRLLFQNSRLSHAILHGTDEATVEEPMPVDGTIPDSSGSSDTASLEATAPITSATAFARSLAQNRTRSQQTTPKTPTNSLKRTFSAPKFQKSLELDSLHGNLINLCLDTSIFRLWRDQGIIRFFDELLALWSKTPRHLLLNASDSLESMTPDYDVSIKTTINWRSEPSHIDTTATSLVKLDQVRNSPPEWINHPDQVKASKKLYQLHDDVVRTKDPDLLQIYHKLASLDYLTTSAETPSLSGKPKTTPKNPELFALYLAMLDDFAQKVLAKQPRPAKLSARVSQPHSNSNTEQGNTQDAKQKPHKTFLPEDEPEKENEFSVPIYRVTKVRAQKPAPQEIQDAAEEVQILAQRLSRKKKVTERELSELAEAELVIPEKPKRSRRFMKKLVIE